MVYKDSQRLLIVSSVRWNYLWQRHQSLACAAAERGWQVDYVEPTPRSLGHIVGYLKRKSSGTVQRLDHGPLPDGVHVLRMRQLWRVGLAAPYDMALVYTPDLVTSALLKSGRPHHIVYDAVLDWARVPRDWGRPAHWKRIEGKLVGDPRTVCITDGPGIQDSLSKRGISSSVIPPAADPPFEDSGNRPQFSERQNRALYFGGVHSEIDVRIFDALISGGIPVDIVGIVRDEMREDLRDLGVSIRPPVSVSEIARLATTYKLLLLPYRGVRASTTVVPAKLWNCLATGSWVLASGLGSLPNNPALLRVSADDVASVASDHLDGPPTSVGSVPTWDERWESVVKASSVTADYKLKQSEERLRDA